MAEADELQASVRARRELSQAIPVLCEQGELGRAEALLRERESARESEQADTAAAFASVEARLLRAQDRPVEALAAAERGLAHRSELGITNSYVKRCLVEALEAALDLDDLPKAAELLAGIETLQPGELTPSVRAHGHRFRARLDARRDGEQVDDDFRTAETIFREHDLVFHRAVTQLEHAEWLAAKGRSEDARPLLAEARDTFQQLQALPWLDRLEAAAGGLPAVQPLERATSRDASDALAEERAERV